jgi:hypothetical protein
MRTKQWYSSPRQRARGKVGAFLHRRTWLVRSQAFGLRRGQTEKRVCMKSAPHWAERWLAVCGYCDTLRVIVSGDPLLVSGTGFAPPVVALMVTT